MFKNRTLRLVGVLVHLRLAGLTETQRTILKICGAAFIGSLQLFLLFALLLVSGITADFIFSCSKIVFSKTGILLGSCVAKFQSTLPLIVKGSTGK